MLISGKTHKIWMTVIYLFALNRRQIIPSLSLYFLGYKTEERKTKPSPPKQTNKKPKSPTKKPTTVYLERASYRDINTNPGSSDKALSWKKDFLNWTLFYLLFVFCENASDFALASLDCFTIYDNIVQ